MMGIVGIRKRALPGRQSGDSKLNTYEEQGRLALYRVIHEFDVVKPREDGSMGFG